MTPNQSSSEVSGPPSSPGRAGWLAIFLAWVERRPVAAILLVSALAVVINCYPIIFCGRSYVSPASTDGVLVYNGWPPMPGMEQWPQKTPAVAGSSHGSDTAAMMWWEVPLGFVESRALLKDGEMPLWNRYDHAGATLIGQAISMLGDPLHLIVLLGGGAAWAWDLKFLLAKFLFCAGFGLLIRRLLKSVPLALIFSVLAAYCGAFFYINSHPVFFVLAYAPWILLAAIEWLDLSAMHPARWGLVWLLANVSCFNAGHVEAAVVLIGGLNLAAVGNAWLNGIGRADRLRMVFRMGMVTVLFLGLTAPTWATFFAVLKGSFTSHATVNVEQLSPWILPGVFDDLFYYLLQPVDPLHPEVVQRAVAPGSSLLILAGCCLSILKWRELLGETFLRVNSVAILFWAGCVYGWVPNFVLTHVPLINRVGHNDVDFSLLLIMHLTIQCAYGFAGLARSNPQRPMVDLVRLAGMFVVFFAWYLSGYWHRPVPGMYFLCSSAGAIGAVWLFAIMAGRGWQNRTVVWLAVLALGLVPNLRFGLYTFGDDFFLMRPGPRVTLDTPEPAIEKIKAANSEPFRVVGLVSQLMGDYAAVYGLEDIRSCAPVSTLEYMDLVQNFPGMQLTNQWMLKVRNPALAQPLLNLLNVKYLLWLPDVTVPPGIDYTVTDRESFGVVKNPEAWPRAFWTSRAVLIESNADFIHYLVNNGRKPFVALTAAELDRQPEIKTLTTPGEAIVTPAKNYRLLPNSTEFEVQASAPGVACLTEAVGRDFTVTVNGEPGTVLTVNRAFKGVYLDKPGEYDIKFTYHPRYWVPACVLFWCSVLGSLVLAFVMRGAPAKREHLTAFGSGE